MHRGNHHLGATAPGLFPRTNASRGKGEGGGWFAAHLGACACRPRCRKRGGPRGMSRTGSMAASRACAWLRVRQGHLARLATHATCVRASGMKRGSQGRSVARGRLNKCEGKAPKHVRDPFSHLAGIVHKTRDLGAAKPSPAAALPVPLLAQRAASGSSADACIRKRT